MVSDAHFIPPTDGKVNGIRSSFHMVEAAHGTHKDTDQTFLSR
jgi:endonuclease I